MSPEAPVLFTEPTAVPLPASPPVAASQDPSSTDSLVSVRLSRSHTSTSSDDTGSISHDSDTTVEPAEPRDSRSSVDNMGGVDLATELEETSSEHVDNDIVLRMAGNENESTLSALTGETPSSEDLQGTLSRRGSCSSTDSDTVDWEGLDKTEESEPRDGGSDESTAFLLARLEEENNTIAADPRFGLRRRTTKKTRPPSIHVLKKLVNDPSRSSQRYSMLPNPPPMTELEFWAALVKDYSQTAQRLPTLTANKIKGGVPPPLRGVVWMSMVGSRDEQLSQDFDRFVNETSPYENMIGKDIGRSFPGVDMFKEAGGEGQSMMARVLKVFSLYDEEIGYCQGLGFLVGPLLMNMGDKEAFCVLVRLMEKYDLRSCFMPDLAGLHLRIYQFQSLLTQHMPELSKHLASLQVEAAYLSQWFLSFFAVTCPLPMLFRIYDVILAEGASETIMRVALSLMRRNEEKLMAQTEFEEVMHMLLSRALWEPYSYDADALVNDFVGLTGLVTRESLQNLEKTFKDAKEGKVAADEVVRAGFFTDASSAASRFLGRLWTSNSPAKATGASLSPSPAPAGRPTSLLKRHPSKQSIASTVNGTDSSEGTNSTGTEGSEATTITRDSSAEVLSLKSRANSLHQSTLGAVSKEDKDLHGQIEDLLTALSEMQRDQGLLTTQLQKEREERDEDHRLFKDLIFRIKNEPATTAKSNRRQTSPDPTATLHPQTMSLSYHLGGLVERVDDRLAVHRDLRRSSMLETKQRLRESLVELKDQLTVEASRSQELNRRLDEQDRDNNSLREQLTSARGRLQDGYKERQKLESTIRELRAEKRASSTWSEYTNPTLWRSDNGESNRKSVSSSAGSSPTLPSGGLGPSSGGLRELKLSRNSGSGGGSSSNLSPGNPSLPSRSSSLATQSVLSTKGQTPATEESLLIELVSAKTGEAVARQELEEVKARMDTLRRMLALPAQQISVAAATQGSHQNVHRPSPSEGTVIQQSSTGMVESPMSVKNTPIRSKAGPDTDKGDERKDQSPASTLTPPAEKPASAGASGGLGGFWPWGRRQASTSAVKPSIDKDKDSKKEAEKELIEKAAA